MIMMKPLYWLISAAITVAGAGVMLFSLTQRDKDAENLVTSTETYMDVKNLDINLEACTFRLESAATAEGVTVALKNEPDYTVTEVKDGTLYLSDKNKRIKFFYLGFLHDYDSEVVITVPESALSAVKVEVDAGNSTISGIQAEEFTLDVGAGTQQISDVQCDMLLLENGYGDTYLSNTGCDTLTIRCGSGTMKLEQVTAARDVVLDSGAGDVAARSCKFGSVDVAQGSGDLQIDEVAVNGWAVLSSGAGTISGSSLTVKDSADIECGAGNCILHECGFYGKTSADIGAGDIELTQMNLKSNMRIDCVGDVVLGITGNADEYTFDCDDRLGTVDIAGWKANKLHSGHEKYELSIFGCGDTTVTFEEAE